MIRFDLTGACGGGNAKRLSSKFCTGGKASPESCLSL